MWHQGSALIVVAHHISPHILQVVDAGGITELTTALCSQNPCIVKAAAWTIQHSAMHGSIICDQYASSKVLAQMTFAIEAEDTAPDLKRALSSAIKEIVKHCIEPAPLFILVSDSCPLEVAVAGLSRLYTLLARSVAGRREFVTTGTIMNLQRLEQALGSAAYEGINAINSLFPKDLVTYYKTRS